MGAEDNPTVKMVYTRMDAMQDTLITEIRLVGDKADNAAQKAVENSERLAVVETKIDNYNTQMIDRKDDVKDLKDDIKDVRSRTWKLFVGAFAGGGILGSVIKGIQESLNR